MKLRYFLLLALATLMSTIARGNTESYRFRNYNTLLDMPFSKVSDMAQDNDGFIWVVAKEGIFRFDGNRFVSVNSLSRSDSPTIHGTESGCVAVDAKANVWIIGSGNLYRYNPRNATVDRPVDSLAVCTAMAVDNNNCVWIGTTESLLRFDTTTDTCQTIENNISITSLSNAFGNTLHAADSQRRLLSYDTSTNIKTVTQLSINAKGMLHSVEQTDSDNLLLGFDDTGGLFAYNTASTQIEELIAQTTIHALCRRNQSEYWIAAEDGIYIYTRSNQPLRHIRRQTNNPFSLSENSIYSLLCDKEGGMWVGTFFRGIGYMPCSPLNYRLHIPGKTDSDFAGYIARDFKCDNSGNIWIATEDEGLNCYNPATGQSTNFSPGNPAHPLAAYNVRSTLIDGNRLWVGYYDAGVEVLDIRSGKSLRHYQAGQRGLITNMVSNFFKTRNGDILVNCYQRLLRYDAQNDMFVRYLIDDTDINTNCFVQTNDSTIYAGAWDGLYVIENRNMAASYHHDPTDNNTLIGASVMRLCFDSKGVLWLATNNGLNSFDTATHSFVQYPVSATDLRYNQINDMVFDNNRLWLATEGGLACFDCQTHAFTLISQIEGTPSRRLYYGSTKDSNGNIYFSTLNGFIDFSPRLDSLESEPKLLITKIDCEDFKSGADTVHYINSSTGRLRLNHRQRNVSVDYSLLLYSSLRNNVTYSCFLDGFDEEWHTLQSNQSIDYQNLPPGQYTLTVKAEDRLGQWQPQTSKLSFTILPPFIRSVWAYLIYAALLALAAVLTARYIRQRNRNQRQALINQLDAMKEKEVYDAKIHFFITVAHEIRTPLTLIKLPVEKLKERFAADPQVEESLQLIEKNTIRLTDLCSQLLNVRKVESEKMQLNFIKTDVVQLFEEVLERFAEACKQKELRIEQSFPDKHFVAAIDTEAFTKICSNMINNAVKYSDTFIRFEIHRSADDLSIGFINDGELIDPQDKDKVFSLFYRSPLARKQTGSGIGLSFARQLAEMHMGSLDLLFDRDGLNHFMLTMPLKQEFEFDSQAAEFDFEEKEEAYSTLSPEERPTILIVEDNRELRKYLTDCLERSYNVIAVSNGNKALQVVQQSSVSIVLSDIMMPGINGMVLCKTLKANVNLCNIPVILMTANNSDQNRIESIEYGADDYIEKPFSLRYLTARIDNILKTRQMIYNNLSQKPINPFLAAGKNSAEQEFFDNFYNLVERELSNTQLDMDFMSTQLGVSRSSLYKKVKSSIDLSPNDFIRITRLKRAAEMLQSGQQRIKEVAYDVGFSSTAYFSTCFLKYYGLSPTEYVQRNNHNGGQN